MLKKGCKWIPAFALLLLLLVILPKNARAVGDVKLNSANFPDTEFRNYMKGFDKDEDGSLSPDEIGEITDLYLSGCGISSLKGIEHLPYLCFLYCSDNNLTSVDLSQNRRLEYAELSQNKLTSINVSENSNLQHLTLDQNQLTSIDLSSNVILLDLSLSGNKLKSLDLSQNNKLQTLCCDSNSISVLDLSLQPELFSLICADNKLKSLDLSNNPKIEYLYCNFNSITALNITGCTKMYQLDCSCNTALAGLNVSKMPDLRYLYIGWTDISSLNVTKCPALTTLDVGYTKISSLNISCCPALCHLYESGKKNDYSEIVTYEIGDPYALDSSYQCFTINKGTAVKTASASIAAPVLSASNTSSNIKLSWNAVSGADSYELWRMEKGGSYEKIASQTAASFKDTKVSKGVTYYYQVRGVAGTKSGPFSKAKEITRNPFTDVSASASYFNSVMWALRHGIAGGTTSTTFSPNEACTRYQFAVMLWRLNGKPYYYLESLPFTDVKPEASYYTAVAWAYANGIISGTNKTTFSPNAEVKRYQVVQMLYKSVGKPEVDTSYNPFKDVSKKASYYKAVLWAVENGITSGTSKTTFSPNATCKRYQMAVFLYKMNNIYHYFWD